MTFNENRFSAQGAIAPQTALENLPVTIIGTGGIGRQVAMQLAALGVRRMQLIDPGRVQDSDITVAGYTLAEFGQLKVDALAAAIAHGDPEIAVERVVARFHPTIKVGKAIFCCVGSPEAHSMVWQAAQLSCHFWCDGQIFGESMRILTVTDADGREQFSTSLIAPREASTAGTTLFVGSIAAGLMLHQFTRWLRGLPTDRDLQLNLLASELSAR